MSDQTRINGNVHSWSSVIMKAGNEVWTGFTAISYGDALERVKAYGMGRSHKPLGRTAGKYTVEPVVVTGYKHTMQQMREWLAAQASDGRSYATVEVQFVIQFFESDLAPITVELDRCMWSKNAEKAEENPDPLKEDVEFDCMGIRRNGATLYDSREGDA